MFKHAWNSFDRAAVFHFRQAATVIYFYKCKMFFDNKVYFCTINWFMMHLLQQELKLFLDEKVREFNRTEFIETVPIFVPHQFSLKQDVEIMGFFASVFAIAPSLLLV